MKANPSQEQIKGFWEWCGLHRVLASDGRYHWFDGNEEIVSPTDDADCPVIDLNNLFKWAVPRLSQPNEYPYLTAITMEPPGKDELTFTCYLYYEALHDDGFIEREEIQTIDEDPALALFWAINQLIECDGNK